MKTIGKKTIAFVALLALYATAQSVSGELLAGAAKIDITSRTAPANDRLYARALVLKSGEQTAVLVTLDVVAIEEIGPIKAPYLANVRAKVQAGLGISPESIMINASHCHGSTCRDVEDRTVQAIREATKKMVPVRVGVGVGREDRVQENRRLKLKDGTELDVRHAYSLPPDSAIAGVGPIDPEIGIVRIDREDGTNVAVIYNFACHPIQGVPNGLNTADMTGFSSKVIEENMGEGSVALFVQGCGGDINPVFYKSLQLPRNAETLGNTLGLSTLRALRKIKSKVDPRLRVIHQKLDLPRAQLEERILAMEEEQKVLLSKLHGTTLNLKQFLPLVVKYRLAENFPSYHAHRYAFEKKLKREDLRTLDNLNRRRIESYIANIHTMESLTRLQTNLRLLRKNQQKNLTAKKRMIETEVVGLRIGDFVLVTFPGELVVDIGLNIKKASPHDRTFVAGYTNGYIYYAPTEEQLKNVGRAQEDSDCILGPGWQKLFEDKALEVLNRL